jgi:hypothetical protein
MIRHAKDLSPDQKQAIESLLGQELSEEDNVSVRRLPPPAPLSSEHRREIVDGLRKYFAQADAQRQPMSDREAENVINEAIRSTKPGYRPVT